MIVPCFLSVTISLKWFKGHLTVDFTNQWVLLKLQMQRGKDRLTRRLAANPIKHQLKHRGENIDMDNWFHRSTLWYVYQPGCMIIWFLMQLKQGSPQNLIGYGYFYWIALCKHFKSLSFFQHFLRPVFGNHDNTR